MNLRRSAMRVLLVIHAIGLRFGIFILPAHYYVQVPNIIELAKTQKVWCKESLMPGIPNDLDKQATNLHTMCLPYRDECAGNREYLDATSQGFGPGFGYIEAQALHCVLRYLKPRRIIEVGSGVSTRCMVHAVSTTKEETGKTTEITCIEPFPSKRLRELNCIRLLEKPVQEVEIDKFLQLERNDFLFIDSAHTVEPGGDVNYLVLEVLPRLKPGVVVHFHDVFSLMTIHAMCCKHSFSWVGDVSDPRFSSQQLESEHTLLFESTLLRQEGCADRGFPRV